MITNSRSLGVWVLFVAVVMAFSMSATAQTTITMSRTVQGLGEDGWLIPGTTSLTITVTMERSADADTITALGVYETLPEGWMLQGSIEGNNPPSFAYGTIGTLSLGWIMVPPFPCSFTYTVSMPPTETGPKTLSGYAEFRTTGEKMYFNTAETVIQVEPTLIEVSQELSGTVGPGGNYYIVGNAIDVTVTMEKVGPDNEILALGFEETLPAGWFLMPGSVGGANPPQTVSENIGLVSFAWFTIPAFPATFTFSVAPSPLASGEACFDGVSRFRLEGPEQLSNTVQNCLMELSCLGLIHNAPECYVRGEQVTIEVTLTDDCVDPFTTLRLEETVPDGWTFVSATGGDTQPAPGATGTLLFSWTTFPVFPYTFTFTVAVPEDETGYQTISGVGKFATTGAEVSTFTVVNTLCRQNFAPEITVVGEDPVTLECGAEYTDAGATALDDLDGDISANITVVNPVDVHLPNTYTITYDVTDSEGLAAVQKTRTVTVQDTLPPVITLQGEALIQVECGTAFTEPGATALDQCDGELSVVSTGEIDVATPGMYTLQYNVQDGAGHAAEEVVRTIQVVDTAAPGITLLGSTPVTVQCGSGYADAGAMASDACAGDLTTALNIVNMVNDGQPGEYTVTYSVSDPAGNAATPVVRTVNVVDTTEPTVTLNGEAVMVVAYRGTFTDPGVIVNDACDLSPTASTTGSVNTGLLGTYELRYSATDDSGNTGTATRTVHVRDLTPPQITLIGAATMYVECGNTFTDPGAVVTDNVDVFPAPIKGTGTVNTQVAGTYTLTYNVRDAAGNSADTKTRTVIVTDVTNPVITLVGEPEVTVQCGANYTDAGATASDACNGDLTASIRTVNPVNTGASGVYYVTYNVSDSSFNPADTVTRTVNVVDTSAPIILLTGSSVVSLLCGGSFTDLGATATDTCDGPLTDEIVTGGDVVDPNVSGTYLITYNVQDASGNVAPTVTRTVYVEDVTPPIITLLGDPEITIDCGTIYTDEGATATDTCDGDLTAQIVVVGDLVDTSQAGQFTITYDVVDNAGNAAEQVARIVTVEGPACEIEGEGGGEGEGEGEGGGEGEGEGEGQVEGEGEVAPDCLLQSVTITSPTGDVVIPIGANALISFTSQVAFVDPAVCMGARVVVSYAIDGVVVAVSDNQEQNFPGVTQLIPGDYTLEVVAEVPDSSSAAAAVRPFSVRIGQDNDLNGLLDNPFGGLNDDGDQWTAVVQGEECDRTVSMMAWRRGAGNVVMAVPRAEYPVQVLTVTVPKSLIAENEEGILIAAVSCDFPSLLGPAQAAQLADLPDLMVPGGVPFEVSIIVSNNNGATFAELDNALLETMPIHIALNGLGFRAGFDASFFAHPTAVSSNPINGLFLEVERGVWSSGAMDNVELIGRTLIADVTSLSTFVPLETPPLGPTIKTIPSAEYPFIAGIVEVNGFVSNTITVKNIGNGVVEGSAALEDPNGVFSLTGTTSYSLSRNMTADIGIVFSPKAAGDFVAFLTLTNGENDPVEVQVRGTGTQFGKIFAWFGCAPSTAPGGWMGDLAVMVSSLLAVLLFGWLARRKNVC